MEALFLWLIDKFLQVIGHESRVSVLVHEAYIISDPARSPKYFVKVTNLSNENDITITHVWFKDGDREVDIINPDRPLTKTLKPTEQWETWFDKELVTDTDGIFSNVRVVLSNQKIYKSRKNTKVRPFGNIA